MRKKQTNRRGERRNKERNRRGERRNKKETETEGVREEIKTKVSREMELDIENKNTQRI